MTLYRTNCQHLDSILDELRRLKLSKSTLYDSYGFQVSLITLLCRLTYIELSSIRNIPSIPCSASSSEIEQLLRSLLQLESLIGRRVHISSRNPDGKMVYGVRLGVPDTDGLAITNCPEENFEQLDQYPGMP